MILRTKQSVEDDFDDRESHIRHVFPLFSETEVFLNDLFNHL